MARTGITYSDVESAVQQLIGRGKNPTVDGIREILGTGSKSTIAQHLRALRVSYEREVPGQMALPQELLALVTGLWEKLNAATDGRILQIEMNARQEVADISHINNKLQQELTIITQQKTAIDEALLLKERQLEECLTQLSDEKQTHHVLSVQHAALTLQLEDMKSENQRLHQLASHIQANLEHYQVAIQKLQIEQNLVLEKQQAFFQQQLNELDTEVKLYRQKAFDMEHAFQSSVTEARALTQQLEVKQLAHDALLQTAQQTALTLAKTEQVLEQQVHLATTRNDELVTMKEQMQVLVTQHAVLNDQHQRMQGILQQRDDTLELLRQEKLFLLQENAELKGYLKKLNTTKADKVHAEY